MLDYDLEIGVFTWKTIRRFGEQAGHYDESKGYIIISLLGHHYYGHVLAWFYVHGEWRRVDHENTTGSDNSISNLRPATSQQNNRNQSIRIDNLLGIKGVSQVGNKFMARIFVDGRRIYLGLFKTVEEASYARQAAAQEYFGEFCHQDERPSKEEA